MAEKRTSSIRSDNPFQKASRMAVHSDAPGTSRRTFNIVVHAALQVAGSFDQQTAGRAQVARELGGHAGKCTRKPCIRLSCC